MSRAPLAINSNYYCLDHFDWTPTDKQVQQLPLPRPLRLDANRQAGTATTTASTTSTGRRPTSRYSNYHFLDRMPTDNQVQQLLQPRSTDFSNSNYYSLDWTPTNKPFHAIPQATADSKSFNATVSYCWQ